MKSFFVLAFVTLFSTAVASERTRPNLFVCSGSNISLTFASTGFDAKPSLRIAQQGAAPRTFSGEQIQFVEAPYGTSASVVEARAFDSFVSTADFIIPVVHVNGFEEIDNVKTILLRTIGRTSIAGPDLVDGAVVEHQAVNLRCKVRFVNF